MNKNHIFFILFLLLVASPLSAQEVRSEKDNMPGRTLGENPRPHRSAERNIIGAPVYYDTLGNVIGSSNANDSLYRRPKHHYLNRLEDEYNNIFLEFGILAGNDFALGAQMAYVPKRWGAYCGGYFGMRHEYFTVGPVLRLSDCGDFLDWQLFGGLTVSRRPGAELGFRLAGPKTNDGFAWTSFTMAAGYANRSPYFSLGLSLSLTPQLFFLFWL